MRPPRDQSALIESSGDVFIGQIFGGYRALELVGRGAMSHVYRAEHVAQGGRFALKLIVAGDEDDVRERVPREAAAMRGLEHPNVVALVDLGLRDDVLFLVMEWVEGGTLADAIARDAPFPPLRAAQIARQIALGLQAIHQHGFVHRDLKPANVMVARSGRIELPKIVDFGLVSNADWTRLTASGCLVGTPLYMSPESIEGRGAGERSDLYSLGIIIAEMLTGSPPFHGPTIHDILTKHLHEHPPTLVGAGGLEVLVKALLAKRPDDRPNDARSVAAILGALTREPNDPDNTTTENSEMSTGSGRVSEVELRTPATLPARIGEPDTMRDQVQTDTVTPVAPQPKRFDSPSQEETALMIPARSSRDMDTGPSEPSLDLDPTAIRTRPSARDEVRIQVREGRGFGAAVIVSAILVILLLVAFYVGNCAP